MGREGAGTSKLSYGLILLIVSLLKGRSFMASKQLRVAWEVRGPGW